MTFDPLLNFSISPKTLFRFGTVKYLASLQENNFKEGGGLYLDITWVECLKQKTCDLVGRIFETCWK